MPLNMDALMPAHYHQEPIMQDKITHHGHHEHPTYTHAEHKIIMLLSELLKINQSVAGQLNKVETEVNTRFAALQAAIDKLTADLADAPLSEEQANSVNDVVAAAQRLDDISVDLPTEPPVV